MAMTMFTRFVNVRSMINVNNLSSFGNELNVVQCSSILFKLYSTMSNKVALVDSEQQSSKRISKAMKVYLQQAKEYKEFIQNQIAEYDIGKRHLANMMGEDPDNFSEKDINRAINYLFPSGLYDPEARPMLAHPNKLYTSRKEAEFDESGRPHHFLFYTTKPNYYEVLHKVAESMSYLKKLENYKIATMNLPTPEDKIKLEGSEWFKKHELEAKLFEDLTDAEYEYLITSMQRVVEHPLSYHVSSFVLKYRSELKAITSILNLPPLQYDDNNRPFILLQNCSRKSARGDVKVLGNGTGNITINGQDILYFHDVQCREQMFLCSNLRVFTYFCYPLYVPDFPIDIHTSRDTE